MEQQQDAQSWNGDLQDWEKLYKSHQDAINMQLEQNSNPVENNLFCQPVGLAECHINDYLHQRARLYTGNICENGTLRFPIDGTYQCKKLWESLDPDNSANDEDWIEDCPSPSPEDDWFTEEHLWPPTTTSTTTCLSKSADINCPQETSILTKESEVMEGSLANSSFSKNVYQHQKILPEISEKNETPAPSGQTRQESTDPPLPTHELKYSKRIYSNNFTEIELALDAAVSKTQNDTGDESTPQLMKSAFLKGLTHEYKHERAEAKHCYGIVCEKLEQLFDKPSIFLTAYIRKAVVERFLRENFNSFKTLCKMQQHTRYYDRENYGLIEDAMRICMNEATASLRSNKTIKVEHFNLNREEVLDFLLTFDGDAFFVYLHQRLTEDNWHVQDKVQDVLESGNAMKTFHTPAIVAIINEDNSIDDATMKLLLDTIIHQTAEEILAHNDETNIWMAQNIRRLVEIINKLISDERALPARITARVILSTLYMTLGYLHDAKFQLERAHNEIKSYAKKHPGTTFVSNTKRSLLIRFAVLFYLEGDTKDSRWLLLKLLRIQDPKCASSECYNFICKIFFSEGDLRGLFDFCEWEIRRLPTRNRERLALPAFIVCAMFRSYSKVSKNSARTTAAAFCGLTINEPSKMRVATKLLQCYKIKACLENPKLLTPDDHSKPVTDEVGEAELLKMKEMVRKVDRVNSGTFLQAVWTVTSILESRSLFPENLLASSDEEKLVSDIQLEKIDPKEGIPIDLVYCWIKMQQYKGIEPEVTWNLLKLSMDNIPLHTFLSVRFGCLKQLLQATILDEYC